MQKIFTFFAAALMSVSMFADVVATPVISGDIEFTDSVIVSMSCATPDADIYYTLDGVTDPKCDCAAAPEYKKPIVIKETTTIKAAAYTGNDWSDVAEVTFTKVDPEPDPTVMFIAFPTENRPENIELAGVNREFTWEMVALDNDPWYVSKEHLNTYATDTIKFRDKANNAKILCEFIPANGDQEGRWQQLYLVMGDYPMDSYKLDIVRYIEELDLSNATNFAWMENAPEPLPEGIEHIVLTEKAKKVIMDGMIYIVRDGKLFDVTGKWVKYNASGAVIR